MKITDILTYQAPPNKHGLFSSWTIKIGDHTSVGPTKEQAEQEAVRAMQAALTGDYTPILLIKEPFYALGWRSTEGYWYCITQIGTPPTKAGWTGIYQSREECEQAAHTHLESY